MSVGFNFLEAPALPAPQVTEAKAQEILATHYGLRARATSLGSNQDKNFVVAGPEDEIVGVLKIANPAFNATEIEAQDLAAELIAEAEPTLRMAVPLPNLAGQKCTAIRGLVDGTAYVRLLRFLPGGTLLDSGYLSPTAVAGLGEIAGRVSRALEGFRHPGLDRVLQWDLRYGAAVVAELISYVADPVSRSQVDTAATEAWARIAPVVDELPRQAVHLDVTDANVVVGRRADGSAYPDGVIDFGDLSDSWAVSELAITVSSVLGHPGSEPISILPAVRAFHANRPLTAAEADVLWPMVVLRTAVLIASGVFVAVKVSQPGKPTIPPTPAAAPNTGPFTGTYTAAYGPDTDMEGGQPGLPAAETWGVRSVCRPSGCVATAARRSGDTMLLATLVFDDVGGRWLAAGLGA